MNTQLIDDPEVNEPVPSYQPPAKDSLARGVAWMLIFTVAQRAIGFVRNVIVCRMLDPSQLGTWNLMNGFLGTIAPFIVLGVPGSFVRYVEHYRQRNQLRGFLFHSLLTTTVLTCLGIGVIIAAREQVAWLTFGSREASSLVVVSAAALVAVIAYNVAVELLTAMRLIRWNSHIQFLNSLIFTVVAVGLLATTSLNTTAVLVGYVMACVASVVVATLVLRSPLAAAITNESPVKPSALWSRVGPFIAWYWLWDLLANLFGTVDRLMIIHCAGLDERAATEMVGQYHSSQIIGTLLITVIALLSRILLSFLSQDWESGRQEEAQAKLGFAIKLTSLVVTAVSICTLIVAPAIFTWALRGKYVEGYRVLPTTMAYCVWFGLLTMAVNSLWCHERPGLACLSVGIGLLINVVLNYLWLPIWGLSGAVFATAIANFVALGCICFCCHWLGMRFGRGIIVTLVLPACLVLGPLLATTCFLVVNWHGWRYGWLFSESEHRQLATIAKNVLCKFITRGIFGDTYRIVP